MANWQEVHFQETAYLKSLQWCYTWGSRGFSEADLKSWLYVLEKIETKALQFLSSRTMPRAKEADILQTSRAQGSGLIHFARMTPTQQDYQIDQSLRLCFLWIRSEAWTTPHAVELASRSGPGVSPLTGTFSGIVLMEAKDKEGTIKHITWAFISLLTFLLRTIPIMVPQIHVLPYMFLQNHNIVSQISTLTFLEPSLLLVLSYFSLSHLLLTTFSHYWSSSSLAFSLICFVHSMRKPASSFRFFHTAGYSIDINYGMPRSVIDEWPGWWMMDRIIAHSVMQTSLT